METWITGTGVGNINSHLTKDGKHVDNGTNNLTGAQSYGTRLIAKNVVLCIQSCVRPN